jgi:hypothetical protein
MPGFPLVSCDPDPWPFLGVDPDEENKIRNKVIERADRHQRGNRP